VQNTSTVIFFIHFVSYSLRYCDERGIYTFHFITIAEIIHLKFNKFKFVLTTSKLFLCNLCIPFISIFKYTHMFCKCQNVEKNRAVPTKGFLECKTVANRKINFFSFFQKAMWYFSKLSGWRDAHHTRPVAQARHSFAYERINNLIVV
jgi:hypothetical protein